jgi:hypothetical protein
MKSLKLSFALILIAVTLFSPGESKPQSKKPELQQSKPEARQTPASESPPAVQESPYSVPNSHATQEQTLKKETQPSTPTDSTWWFNLFIVIFTGCLVFVGIAQVVIYKRQARLMRKGLRLTRKTAERQLRAYLSVDPEIICLENEKPVIVRVRITNYGQTPAYDLTVIGGIGCAASFETLEPPTPVDAEEITKSAIPPNGRNDQFHTSPHPVSSEVIAALQAGKRAIWIYGEIIYIDAFKNPRFKKYRFMVGGSVGMQGKSMAICKEGNDEN